MQLQFLAIPFRQALQRYYTLYDYSVNMEGRIYDILMYLQEHCEDGNAKHRHYLFQGEEEEEEGDSPHRRQEQS